MKIIVTGGAGFIGSHLVDSLVEERYTVIVIDNLSTGIKSNINTKAEFYKLDIQDKRIQSIFQKEKPDIVYHLAAAINVRKSIKDPLQDIDTNISGSINLLEASKLVQPKKFIFVSTGGALYGDAAVIPTPEDYEIKPLSPYGINKFSIEKYLYYYWKMFGLNFTVLRLANVYGPRQNAKGEAGVIAIFCNQIFKNIQPVINGNGLQTRDFIYVDDVITALKLVLNKGDQGAFNIGTGKETNIKTIFEKISHLTNSSFSAVFNTKAIEEQRRSCLNVDKATRELGWTPKVSLEDGLLSTVNWFKENIN